MNKKILIPVLTALILAVSYMAFDVYAASETVVGDVVEVAKVLQGQDGKVSSADAMAMISQGKPIALKADNGTIYFVYAGSGANAAKKLAKLADGKVEVTGKTKKVGGMNVIIAASFKNK
jgi:hypothetical protein